jgi:hypothetical protein
MPRSLSQKDSEGFWDSLQIVPKLDDFSESSNFLLVNNASRIVRRLVNSGLIIQTLESRHDDVSASTRRLHSGTLRSRVG